MTENIQSGLLVQLCAVLLFCASRSLSQTTTTTEFPFLEVFTCQDLGFVGSTLNQCGYCVDGKTNLTTNFGEDCKSTCGEAYRDCAGECNGMAYIDECSGQCVVSPNSPVQINRLPSAAVGNSIVKAQSRDCRGLCHFNGEDDRIQFWKDNCGICVIQESSSNHTIENVTSSPQNISTTTTVTQTTTNITNANQTTPTITNATQTIPSPTTTPSPNISSIIIASKYKDCSGACYTPATENMMASNNSDTCYQCIGPNTVVRLHEYQDNCGNCKSNSIPCLCARDQTLDLCGVCGGKNDSCITIMSAFPAIIPSQTTTQINILGVSLKSKYHTICLFIRRNIGPDGRDEDKFVAQVDGSSISCTVNLQEGNYDLHLAVEEDGKTVSISNMSVPFTAYSKLASITSRTSSSMVISSTKQNFTASFSTHNLQRVNNIHCTMVGDAWSLPIQVISSNITNDQTNCELPYPPYSSFANITVSLDGRTPIAGPFVIRFFAPIPEIADAYVAPEGDNIVIFFDNDIASVANLSSCSDIFTRDTVEKLGINASCVWVTKRQHIVTLGFIERPRNTSNEDMILHFLDGVLAVDNETFVQTAKNLSVPFTLSEEKPIAILVGPKQIPPCGTFTLDGHQSIRIQRRVVRFQWNVSIITNQTSVPVNGSLGQLLRDATVANMPSLVIQSTLLELGTPYQFTLTVTNGNSSNQSSSASLSVIRDSRHIPMVMIEPSIAHYPDSISVDQRFTLHAHLAMPACQFEFYGLSYRWSVSNPKVKFDLKQINKESYTVMPYTLYPGENVTFSVRVTMNNDPNMTSESSITFQVKSSKIRMVLQGGYQRTTGVSNSSLVLNASQSYLVDTPYIPLVYRWICLEEDHNPCYNYNSSINEVLLVTNPVTRNANLSLPANKLRPGSMLTFIVHAFSPLNASQISESQSVRIYVFNGSAPAVSIDSISAKDDKSKTAHMEDIIYLIHPMSDVYISAHIRHTVPLKEINWGIPGFMHDLEPFSLNASLQNNLTTATLQIPRDYIIANGVYKINLTATNVNDEHGWAVSSFAILPPVTGCNITIPNYQAFQMVLVNINSCSASHRTYPLSYQVYFNYNSNLIPLSPEEYHLPIEIMGPPSLANNSESTAGENIFTVQVCDATSSCWWFTSNPVQVSEVADLHASADHALLMANIAKLRGDYMSCLRRHSLYMWAVNPAYRMKNELEVESHIADALICARQAAISQCNESSCFGNLFILLMPIPIDNNPSRDFILAEIVQKGLNRLDTENKTLDPNGAQYAILILEKIYKFNTSNTDIAKIVSNMEAVVEKLLARSLHPGQTSILRDSKGQELVAMKYSLLNDPFEIQLHQDANHSIGISFRDEAKERFHTWQCEGVNGSLCRGIVVELQFYPKDFCRPMEVDLNNTVSDVVGVALLNPTTGDKMMEKSPLTLKLTANYTRMFSNLTYNCYFWDEETKEWSSDGVDTDKQNKSVFFCKTEKTAIYAVIGTVPTLTVAEIVGIVLGVLAALALIALIAFLAWKKARTKTMRVSVSKGYHPSVQ